MVAVFCVASAATLATSEPPPPAHFEATFGGDRIVLDRNAPIATQRIRAQLVNVPSLDYGVHSLNANACAAADDGGTLCDLLPVTVRVSVERGGSLVDHRISFVPTGYMEVPAFHGCTSGQGCDEIVRVDFELALDAGISSATVDPWTLQTTAFSYDEAARDGGAILLDAMP